MVDKLDKILVIDLEATCWAGDPPPGQDREIIEIRIPEGNDVEIAGRTATFTALRAEQPVVLVVKFDDGSELEESVVPTANAVIRVRSASAVAPSAKPAVPGTPGGKATAKPPGVRGPRFIDDPYE